MKASATAQYFTACNTLDSTFGSDHYPIIASFRFNKIRNIIEFPLRWIFEKAYWETFQTLCTQIQQRDILNENIDKFTDNFATKITDLAKECIPKTSGESREHKCNPLCTIRRKINRRLEKMCKENPTEQNKENYRKVRNKYKQAKQQLTMGNILRIFEQQIKPENSMEHN